MSDRSEQHRDDEAVERQAPREYREGHSIEERLSDGRGFGHELKKLMASSTIANGKILVASVKSKITARHMMMEAVSLAKAEKFLCWE